MTTDLNEVRRDSLDSFALVGRDELIWGSIVALSSGAAAFAFFGFAGGAYGPIAMLSVVGLLIAILAHRRPRLVVFALIALTPFERLVSTSISSEYVGIYTGSNEFLIAFAAIGFLVPSSASSRVPGAVRWALVLILSGGLVSLFAAELFVPATWGFVRWAVLATVLVAMFRHLSSQDLPTVAALICAANVVVVFFAVMQHAGNFALVGAPYYSVDSTFGFYTQFAWFTAAAGVIGIGLAVWGAQHASSASVLLGVITTFSSMTGLVLASSRGGALAFVVGLIVFSISQARRPARLAAAIVAFAMLAFALWTVLPEQATDRFESRFVEANTGDVTRFEVRQFGLSLTQVHPLGIGYGNFLEAQERQGRTKTVFHAQNTPLQISLDVGWLGALGFLILMAVPFVRIRGHWPPSPIQAAFLGAVAGFLIQGWFEYLFVETSIGLILFALTWGAMVKESAAKL